MDEFGCDYDCRTVGESIRKYNIADDWRAQFDVYDGAYPLISVQVRKIRKTPAMMALKLRIVENPDDEYAGCMVFADRKIVAFKVDHMRDLIKAMEVIKKG